MLWEGLGVLCQFVSPLMSAVADLYGHHFLIYLLCFTTASSGKEVRLGEH